MTKWAPRPSRRRHIWATAALLPSIFMSAAAPTARTDESDAAMLRDFETIPVLEGGRPMPMATFSRLAVMQISGRARWRGRPASDWVARLVFDPALVESEPLVLIAHPEVFDALGMDAHPPRRRVSYAAIAPGFERLSRAAREAASVPAAQRTPAEREFVRLASALELYGALARGETPAIRPVDDTHWLSPAECSGRDDDISRAFAMDWRALKSAWTAGDAEAFRGIAARLRERVLRAAGEPGMVGRLRGEIWFHRLAPFRWAFPAYVAAALLLGIAGAAGGSPRGRIAGRTGLTAALAALALHTAGLALRTFIMGRPPVTNLYSTFLFVAWSCAVAAVIHAVRRRGRRAAWTGLAVAAVLLLVAGRYEADGDTMARVVAVLDSNLWLTAHVLTIMLGYAGCLMAGAAAHAALFVRWRSGPAAAADLFRVVRGHLAFGLVFTLLGTMLGGVWADQSWGRFWGWDPKENGALLIILWVAAVLHARGGGLIDDIGVAAGAVAGVAVVLTAWLGVNLLGIGLHAYGFTSGTARGWLAVTLVEVLIATAALVLIRRSDRRRPGALPVA